MGMAHTPVRGKSKIHETADRTVCVTPLKLASRPLQAHLVAMPRAFHSKGTFHLPFARAEIWPILRRADAIGRSLGWPAAQFKASDLPEGGTESSGRARVAGVLLRWKELPFEWLEGEFYRASRIFQSGPFLKWTLAVELSEETEGQTCVSFSSDLQVKRLLRGSFLRRWLEWRTRRRLPLLLKQITEFLRGEQNAPFPDLPKTRAREKALREAMARLREIFWDARLISKLEGLVRDGSDLELLELRPAALARRWHCDLFEAIRLLLHAAQAELLQLRWIQICPSCRLPGDGGASLREIGRTFSCPACGGRFEAQFDKTVELQFAVNPAIRQPAAETFCLGDPGRTPHVVSQLLLAAGQRRPWKMPELNRAYRLRSPQIREPVTLRPEDGPTTIFQPVIVCKPDHFEVRYEYRLVPDYAVQFLNPNEFPIQLLLEKPEWNEDVLTAARITNWQEFRDLFPAEVLAPGEAIPVEWQLFVLARVTLPPEWQANQADVRPYRLIREHFEVVQRSCSEQRGAIVKVMGADVLAVFSKLEEALAALGEIYQRVPALNPDPSLASTIGLRMALHAGPCLAINSDDKLDYFGPSAKLLLEMISSAERNGLVLTEEIHAQPQTQAFLESTRRKAKGIKPENGAPTLWHVSMM